MCISGCITGQEFSTFSALGYPYHTCKNLKHPNMCFMMCIMRKISLWDISLAKISLILVFVCLIRSKCHLPCVRIMFECQKKKKKINRLPNISAITLISDTTVQWLLSSPDLDLRSAATPVCNRSLGRWDTPFSLRLPGNSSLFWETSLRSLWDIS